MREKVITRIEPNVTVIPKLQPMPRRKRVAAYARVSTSSDEQMESIEAQRDYYSKYIAANTQWDFVGIYADATVIIGLKQNPTHGRRFSPIFLLKWAFCGAKRKMLL